MKKLLSGLLACVMMVGMMTVSVSAYDLEEYDLAAAAIEGMGGSASGSMVSTMTRADFCSLAVVISGNSDTVSSASYTSAFNDVLPTDSYYTDINLMCTLGYINGMGNGTFEPNRGITIAEVTTVCLRMLGYSSSDIGYFWPRDYVATASNLGLLDGISTTYTDTITYAEGLDILLRMANQLNASGREYLSEVGASTATDVVVLDNSYKNGADTNALYVYSNGNEVPYTQKTAIGDELVGTCRGTLIFNVAGEVIGFVPNEDTRLTANISSVDANSITFTDGSSIVVPSSATVIMDEEATTFGSSYYALETYSEVVICYGSSGTVQMILPQTAGLMDGYVITGYYDAADPNPTQPETVTVMGTDFDVNDGVSFSGLALGDQICMTLDATGDVIDVCSYSSTVSDDMIGVLSGSSVTLTCGITVPSVTTSAYDGQLVKLVDTESKGTYAYTLSYSSGSGSLYVSSGKLGSRTLASDVVIYESIGDTAASKISLSDIAVDTVSSSDVTYYHLDDNGQVDIMLLDNVTGDLYTYGFFVDGTTSTKSSVGGTVTNEDGSTTTSSTTITTHTLAVETSTGTTRTVATGAYTQYDGEPGGMAWDDDGNLISAVVLEATEELDVSAFTGTSSLVGDGETYVIADDVQVYYKDTDTWTTLAQAKTFGVTFVGYFDRDPDEGGKIRIIIVDN
ncbi:S-layer homology domain-containing protein [Bengtsoniella intestinalis]|uniref:S-layer homology domain-containing protein n=1 Tax=Bengtsoniella intestinalis TaxID=3073143 RepID=UPI00391F6C37